MASLLIYEFEHTHVVLLRTLLAYVVIWLLLAQRGHSAMHPSTRVTPCQLAV